MLIEGETNSFIHWLSSTPLDDADLPYTEEFLENDRVKFDKADTDGDGVLSKAEFGSFIHPTQDNMVGYMIQEHLKKYDMDKDGMISLEEYMGK